VAVVEAFAGRGNVWVNEPAYRALHAALLERCRAPADAAGGARPAVLARLEAVVEPWLTPRSLAAADRQTLASLLDHIAELERDLGVRHGIALGRLAALLAFLAIVSLVGWYVIHMRTWTPAVEACLDWLRGQFEKRPLLCIGAAVPVLVLAALGVLARWLRA
jgi:hypothetical protein